MSTEFPDSVVVCLDPQRPDFGVKLVENVPDALSALHRHGLEEALHGPQSDLWKSAAGALVKADIEPNTSNLRAAYEGFLRLVKIVAPVPTSVRLRVSPRGLREHVEAFFMT
ncbi:hypothetical protein [Methylorubrum sp. SB2]|uniref:hypothetical protein n=1 Tax=Methylorubrum subtropicum TaxID=3138812 RepID=UPI00313ADFF7